MDEFQKQNVSRPVLDGETRRRIEGIDEVDPSQTLNLSGSTGEGFWVKNKWFVLILVLGMLAVAVLAWLALRKPSVSGQPDFKISIEAPTQINAGGEVVLKAILANNESRTVDSPTVEVVFPSGATFIQAEPKPSNLSGTLYSLSDIAPGANVVLWLKVKMDGSVGDSGRFLVKSKYKLSGISADFETTTEHVIALSSAGLTLNWAGPETAANGQPVVYTLRYSNQSEQDVESMRVLVSLPPAFQLASTSPSANYGSSGWDIGDFKIGVEGELKLEGSFSSSSGQTLPFTAEMLVADGKGGFFKQAQAEFRTSLGSEPLVVTQEFQAGKEGDVVFAGDNISYSIKYQNLSSSAARGVRIVFAFESDTVDLASVRAEGAKISNREVTWSAGSTGSLEVLNPNSSGTLQVSAKVKKPAVSGNYKNPEVKTSVKIISNEYDSFLNGNSVTLKVGSEATLAGSASYSSGAKPIKVGNETYYEVSLSLSNTTSDLLDSELIAYIPSGAKLDASSVNLDEAGRINFDPTTGRLSWKVGVLRAHSGTFIPKRELKFKVGFIPSAAEVGDVVDLADKIEFIGKDAFADREVVLTSSKISTSAFGSGEGRVTP